MLRNNETKLFVKTNLNKMLLGYQYVKILILKKDQNQNSKMYKNKYF